jgi:hypothetical protein
VATIAPLGPILPFIRRNQSPKGDVSERCCCHSENLPCFVVFSHHSLTEDPSAGLLDIGDEVEPCGKVFGTLPSGQIESDFCQKCQDCHFTDARDLGQIHTCQERQGRDERDGKLIFSRFGFSFFLKEGFRTRLCEIPLTDGNDLLEQLGLDLNFAILQLALMKIVGFHRLFQREQTVVRPDPIQRFQEGLFRGFDSAVTQLGECFGIPFPVQNRSNDCHFFQQCH